MARKRSEKKEPAAEPQAEKPKAEPKKVEQDKGEIKCTGLSGSGCDFKRVQLPFCKGARGGDGIRHLTFCYEHKLIIDKELERTGAKL